MKEGANGINLCIIVFPKTKEVWFLAVDAKYECYFTMGLTFVFYSKVFAFALIIEGPERHNIPSKWIFLFMGSNCAVL